MDNRQSPATPLERIQLVPQRVEQPAPAPPPVEQGAPAALLVEQPAPAAPPVEQPSIGPLAYGNDGVVEADRLKAVYSSADLEVQPPVLLYPQLPAPLMIGSPSEAVNRMELIVSEHGLVEHVRLVEGPRRMPDMMLLSGAKMWRFEPAVRDGARVRYRTVVSWFGVP
jgi:hypothetical protein